MHRNHLDVEPCRGAQQLGFQRLLTTHITSCDGVLHAVEGSSKLGCTPVQRGEQGGDAACICAAEAPAAATFPSVSHPPTYRLFQRTPFRTKVSQHGVPEHGRRRLELAQHRMAYRKAPALQRTACSQRRRGSAARPLVAWLGEPRLWSSERVCEDAINTAHVGIHSQGEFATDLIPPLQCLRVNQNKVTTWMEMGSRRVTRTMINDWIETSTCNSVHCGDYTSSARPHHVFRMRGQPLPSA